MATLMTIKKADPKKAREYFHAKNEFTTGPMELNYMLKELGHDINVVDLRDTADYQKEHIPGSVNLPKDQWDTERGLQKDKANILLCYSQQCHLASKAAERFSDKGYSVMEMEGGFKAWKEYGLDIELMSRRNNFSR